MRTKDAMLLLVGQSPIQRCYFHAAPVPGFDSLHGIADVAFSRKEAQDISAAFFHEFRNSVTQPVEWILID